MAWTRYSSACATTGRTASGEAGGRLADGPVHELVHLVEGAAVRGRLGALGEAGRHQVVPVVVAAVAAADLVEGPYLLVVTAGVAGQDQQAEPRGGVGRM